MIEDVVELGAELDVNPLLDHVVLEERPVPGVRPRRAQIGLAQAVVGKRISRRGHESRRVEPMLQSRIARLR